MNHTTKIFWIILTILILILASFHLLIKTFLGNINYTSTFDTQYKDSKIKKYQIIENRGFEIQTPKNWLHIAYQPDCPGYVGDFWTSKGLISYEYGIFNPFHTHTSPNLQHNNHPLELKVAFLFALSYIIISLITKWSLTSLGNLGLDLLSFIVGLSDIDAFLLNIFQGKFTIAESTLAIAVMQAIISNNIFKMGICWFIADKPTAQQGLKGFLVVIFINLVLLFILRFII